MSRRSGSAPATVTDDRDPPDPSATEPQRPVRLRRHPGYARHARRRRAASTSASSGRCSPSSGRCSARRSRAAAARSTTTSPRRWRTSSSRPPRRRSTGSQRAAVSDAVKLAELWLDPATDFPAGATEAKALVGHRVGGREPAHVEAAVRPGGPAGGHRVGRGAARGGPRAGRADDGDARADGRPGVRQPARQRAGPAGRRGAHLHRHRHAGRARPARPRCCRRTSRSSPRTSTGPRARS